MADNNLAAVDNTDTYIAMIGTALMALIVIVFISIVLVVIARLLG